LGIGPPIVVGITEIGLPHFIEEAVFRSTFEHPSHGLVGNPRQASTHGSDVELQTMLAISVGKETVDVMLDDVRIEYPEVLILGGNGKATAYMTVADSHLGSVLL